MPFVPYEYTGPIVGYNKGDIHFEKGYGQLTAGFLSLWGSGGGKSFGVRGQGNPDIPDSTCTKGEQDQGCDSPARKGVKFPPEIPGFCEDTYMVVTVLVKRNFNKAKTIKLETKGYPWR